MRQTTRNESGTSARKGLQFTEIEEANVSTKDEPRIYDAEGVRVNKDDELIVTTPLPGGRSRLEAVRVCKIKSDGSVCVMTTGAREVPATLLPKTVNNFCRVVVDVDGVATPVVAVVEPARIHTEDGVDAEAGLEFEFIHPTDGTRRYGRIVEVREEGTSTRPRAVVLVWNDNQKVEELDPVSFERFCSSRRSPRSLSAVETARLLRKALKHHFPGTKFSVRKSGGSAINVRWTDGPARIDVENVTHNYEGGGFDGMIDMRYSVQSWLLPDGSARLGRSSGTEGSRGSVPGYNYARPSDDAELVYFGADFIFCNRTDSARAAERESDQS